MTPWTEGGGGVTERARHGLFTDLFVYVYSDVAAWGNECHMRGFYQKEEGWVPDNCQGNHISNM